MTLPAGGWVDLDEQMVDTYFSQLPWEPWLCLIKDQWSYTAFQIHLPSNSPFVVSPLLTVQGVLLLPADLCVFLETSAARHVSIEVQVSVGDSRR